MYRKPYGLMDSIQMFRRYPFFQELFPDGTNFVSGAYHSQIPGGLFFQKPYCLCIQGVSPGGNEDEAVSMKLEPLGKDILQWAAQASGLGSALLLSLIHI